MKIGDAVGYSILRALKPPVKAAEETTHAVTYEPKMKRIAGGREWEALRGKTVLDFGCGAGQGCIEMAQHGATQVIGLDIRPQLLENARRAAREAGVASRCRFTTEVDFDPVDVVVSIDAFEHFDDPGGALKTMHGLLRLDGYLIGSFGPPWYHPRGGHTFSVFPWSHLLFTEAAQLRWRSDFKNDGATRFSEVEGGLNGMTIQRFSDLVDRGGFRIDYLKAVPIRPLAWAHMRLTREFTTSCVDFKLVKQG